MKSILHMTLGTENFNLIHSNVDRFVGQERWLKINQVMLEAASGLLSADIVSKKSDKLADSDSLHFFKEYDDNQPDPFLFEWISNCIINRSPERIHIEEVASKSSKIRSAFVFTFGEHTKVAAAYAALLIPCQTLLSLTTPSELRVFCRLDDRGHRSDVVGRSVFSHVGHGQEFYGDRKLTPVERRNYTSILTSKCEQNFIAGLKKGFHGKVQLVQ